MYQALAETVLARVREHDHPIDRLRAVIDATLAFHRDRPQLIGGLFQLWALGGRDLIDGARARAPRRAGGARRAGRRPAGGIARKEVRPCDPERIVDLVLAFVEGAMVHHVLGIARTDDTTDELARRVLEPLRAQRRRKRVRP